MYSRITIFILIFLSAANLFGQGKVYIVMGSDTGIWEGLSTSRYHDHYLTGLYTDPARNGYKVMDPAFRSKMVDSYGTPLKMTWWMMAGNTFRYGDNTDVPIPNSIVFYLMKKYHGENAKIIGDELTLHYHTFTWTDYNKDGIYYWNQALNYDDYIDDFKYTLAQLLIDEDMFPVSFRSGWHFMENKWQNYLENILPFSLHNDYPHKRYTEEEPIGNIYDWSQASSEFVPFHPSKDNYQLPGNLKGYDDRSIYMESMSQDLMNHIFEEARNGKDQVVCIWAHLPEDDFLYNIQRVDTIVQKSAKAYTDVKFRYCTAVEAMQRWLKTNDEQAPALTVNEETSGDKIYYNLSTDEKIFQNYPFVAVKDVYENYNIIPCESTGENSWKTTVPVDKKSVAKVGFAVTDTVGNLTKKFIKYLPDDQFIDNNDAGYSELYGDWKTEKAPVWDLDYRTASINPGDSVQTAWNIPISQTAAYNIFIQVPPVENPVSSVSTELELNGTVLLQKDFDKSPEAKKWIYIGTAQLTSGNNYILNVKAKNNSAAAANFGEDVVKVSALVKDKEIAPIPGVLDFGLVARNDTVYKDLTIFNKGIKELTVKKITSANSFVFVNDNMPFTVPAMGSKNIQVNFSSGGLGSRTDTLYIESDDPNTPVYKLVCNAQLELPFKIIDNEDSLNYSEHGSWFLSNAMAYGPTSRYAWLNADPLASASFKTRLEYSGIYEIYGLVPKTVNASEKACAILSITGNPVDTIYYDQNEESGKWVKLIRNYLPAGPEIELKIADTGLSTAGIVLRADAVMFALKEEISDVSNSGSGNLPVSYNLKQNYPNPFNPSTKISYQLPESGNVTLKVYDILGREVTELVNGFQKAGYYTETFDASNLASGIYFYKLQAGNFVSTKKMILLQ